MTVMSALNRDTLVQLLGGSTMTARRKAKRARYSSWVGIVSIDRPQTAYLNSVDERALGGLHVKVFEIADDVLATRI